MVDQKCKVLSNYVIRADGTCVRYETCRGRKGCLAKGAPTHKESSFPREQKRR
jgi:hypothetical protein